MKEANTIAAITQRIKNGKVFCEINLNVLLVKNILQNYPFSCKESIDSISSPCSRRASCFFKVLIINLISIIKKIETQVKFSI